MKNDHSQVACVSGIYWYIWTNGIHIFSYILLYIYYYYLSSFYYLFSKIRRNQFYIFINVNLCIKLNVIHKNILLLLLEWREYPLSRYDLSTPLYAVKLLLNFITIKRYCRGLCDIKTELIKKLYIVYNNSASQHLTIEHLFQRHKYNTNPKYLSGAKNRQIKWVKQKDTRNKKIERLRKKISFKRWIVLSDLILKLLIYTLNYLIKHIFSLSVSRGFII